MTEVESYFGFAPLALICPEDAALPGIGGTHQCQAGEVGAPDISIVRFTELKSNPQFASVLRQNKTIVPLDILPLHLQAMEMVYGFGGDDVTFSIGEEQESIANMTVQVLEINPQTNQAVAIGSLPAEFVEMNYRVTSSSDNTGSSSFFSTPPVLSAKMFSLYVLSEDGNTGYAVFSLRWPQSTPTLPSPVGEIIDSFGLLRTP
jgi:hypothetical protein